MAASLTGVFTDTLQERISNSKILVVGAGGIGCEILKNLVLSGFPDIEIIDLDTIDVSNLNRQFLFHKEHVGKSKAQVAKQSALVFNPKVNIKAYHDSITTTDYGVNFFQRFNLVLGALDNRQARNHVNRMCLTANVPLIESGTAGYNGQVELIKKGLTQCYECTPKAAQKSFPGCTIRNTPSEPIHCIVWAKHLFNQLFGEANEDEDVSPDTADPEAGGENAGEDALMTEANDKGNIDRVNTRQWAHKCNYDPEKLFNKFFFEDIKYLLSMSNLWKTRTPPEAINWEHIFQNKIKEKSDHEEERNNGNILPDQKIWTIVECAKMFSESLSSLKENLMKLPEGDHLVWDKDDKPSMDFVVACANIRANIFKIQQKSRFDIKSMAGNIIPAIATTNAITAGIAVMFAFRVLQDEFDKCKSVYIRSSLNPRNQIFVPDRQLNPPNPKCYVCSPKPEVVLKVDTKKMTIKELRDEVLIKALNTIDPDVIIDGKGIIIISSEEGETECNDNKKLCDLHVIDGAILKVDDFFQKYELSVTILHKDAERDEPLFEVIADRDTLKPAEAEMNGKNGNSSTENVNNEENGDDGVSPSKKLRLNEKNDSEKKTNQDDDDDDLVLIEDLPAGEKSTEAVPSTSSSSRKRKTDAGEGPSCSKKLRTIEDSDDDLIILDD